MEKIDAFCVGGPLDGQRFSATNKFIAVPICDEPTTIWDTKAVVKTKTFMYVLEKFSTSKGLVWFWVEEGMCGFDILNILMESHTKVCQDKRDRK